jgi:hypothetical protein
VRADRWPTVWRTLLGLGVLATVAVDAFQRDAERYAPWRVADRPLAMAVVVGAIVLIVVALRGRGAARVVAAVTVVAVVAVGFGVQRHYQERRYALGTGLLLDPLYEYVSDAPPARIAAFGTIQFYPLFGPSFADDVQVFVAPRSERSVDPSVRCREWEQELRRRRPTLILVGPGGIVSEAPDAAWLRGSPSFRAVVRHDGNLLLRVEGPIRLACPSA